MAEASAAAAAPLWHWLGRQLARPEGPGGALVGHLMARANAAPYRLALEALRPEPQDRVLELGFGPGAGIAALAKRVGHVAGIEGSPAMLRLAQRRNRRATALGQVDLVAGDFQRLPWPNACFDKVLAVNVAYFFDRSGSTVAEIRRVLKPGGLAVFYVTDRATMARWPFAGADTHLTYDTAALRRLLLDGGFGAGDISITAHHLPLFVEGLVAVASSAPSA
ncbi:class I SAM-dependent methyltransferase [Xanthobacter sp. V3C-3]|uniref:class I SAM-dependent methyltransferase n=1 Tax=Xanthobacter lutulentifluminis TaxID=3119935 RepID=UPI00372CA528